MIEKHMWKPVHGTNSAKPSPRWGHSCCVIEEELVLFGGYAGTCEIITDSIYMNDIWVYHTEQLQWTEIKTFGTVPTQRSNSSLHYDSKNNRIVMFGGGGPNKTRFSAISILDWETKIWTELLPNEDENCPWERTYHSSELLYPYLIVYGGEGVADLDDLWVCNLETMKWTEVPLAESQSRPCGRRFHSSCLIGNEFFVIAGCYSKYRPLSDVYSIDLTNLVNNGSFDGLEWKEVVLKSSSFLTRWGHACASFENKIYIFGGRFSNDLNDVLVIDMETKKIRTIKTPTETMPKPRRRACINFVGSCMLMFGGFNAEYFNDLHFINVCEGMSKPSKVSRKQNEIVKLINNEETSDLVIETNRQEKVFCHKSFMLPNFEREEKMNEFIQQIQNKEPLENVLEILQSLYKGFGCNPILDKYEICLPMSEEEKDCRMIQFIEKLSSPTENILSRKSNAKVQNNAIVELSDSDFEDFLDKNREKIVHNLEIIIDNKFYLTFSSDILSVNSKYFQNSLSKHFKTFQGEKKSIYVPFKDHENVVVIEIAFNFMMHGLLIVPSSMQINDWINLYEVADYFSLEDLKTVLVYSIWSKIDERNVDEILSFSMKSNIDQLSMACAKLKIKNIEEEVEVFSNKHIQEVYNLNKFEIKQRIFAKHDVCQKKKNSNTSIEGEKENRELYNE